MCAYRCVQLSYTIQHAAVLIIFPHNLQTTNTYQMLSSRGQGAPDRDMILSCYVIVVVCYSELFLDPDWQDHPCVTTDQVTLLFPFWHCGYAVRCCGLIAMLNWVLFCIICFHNRVVFFLGVLGPILWQIWLQYRLGRQVLQTMVLRSICRCSLWPT